jgi:hypothetical protein
MKSVLENTYNLEKNNITDERYMNFLKYNLNGNLLNVPGIGIDTIIKLANCDESIKNTYQLFGKFLSLRNIDDTTESHCNKFINWLKLKDINIRCYIITMSIAEKTNIWIPGIYDEFGPDEIILMN